MPRFADSQSVIALSTLFPEWKGSRTPAVIERVRAGMLQQEQRLLGATSLLAALLSEVDLDGLTEQVTGVFPFTSRHQAELAAPRMVNDERAQQLRWQSKWRDLGAPPGHDGLAPPLVGARVGDGSFNSVTIRLWLLEVPTGRSPLLHLLESWLPFEAELVEWLGH